MRDDINVALLAPGGKVHDEGFVVHDISRRGLCVQMPLSTEVGHRLLLRLGIPTGVIKALCTVRWVEPDNLGTRCGVEFQGLGFIDSCRLKSFLEPHRLNPLSVLDRLLPISVLGLAVLSALRYYGIEIATWRDLRALELPPAGISLRQVFAGMIDTAPTGASILLYALPPLAVLALILFVTWLLFRA